MQVLIAHGDESARTAFARVAARVVAHGLDVVESAEGQEALELLLAADGPRLAVVDWDLPGLDALELCRLVSQFDDARSPYVILLAGPAHIVAEGLDAGASDCIHTPVDAEELRARIGVGRRFAQRLVPHDTAATATSLEAELRPLDEDEEVDVALVGRATLESVLVAE